MGQPIIGVNVKLEVESALGNAKTITDIDIPSSGVASVTAAGHGFSNGDIVVFKMTSGASQLDGQAARVANVSGDDFEIEGLDASGYEEFTAGTVRKVTSFATFAKAQTVSAPNPPPAKIDLTTLIDVVKKTGYGIPEAADGTVGALFNPGGVTEQIIKSATRTNTPKVFRITYATGAMTVLNANVSGGSGFDLQQNQAAKSSVAFTPVGEMLHYEED